MYVYMCFIFLSTARECESGWLAHRNRCIKLITTQADFTTATAKCLTDHGGSLLELDFEEEVEEIVQAVGTGTACKLMPVALLIIIITLFCLHLYFSPNIKFLRAH